MRRPGPRRPGSQCAQGYDTGSAPGPRCPDGHLQVASAGPWPRTGYRGIRLLAALGAGVLVLASSLLASPLPPAAADDPGPDPATQPTASGPDQGAGPGQAVPGQTVPGQPTGSGQGALPGGQGSASGQGTVPAAQGTTQPTTQASAPGAECVPGVERGRAADSSQDCGVNDRVVSRLMECDLQRVTDVQCVRPFGVERGLFGGDVQVLAERNFCVHVGKAARERACAFVVECERLLVCSGGRCGEQEVSNEDRGVCSEI